ncbi:MAG: hypothetical protein WCR95_04490 [Eubacteriales bacterium]
MRKKLIPTLVFLLISAFVLATASYAWFRRNISVEAGSAKVTVDLPVNIMASTEGGGVVHSVTGFTNHFAFGSVLTNGDGEVIEEFDMLVPVTSADGQSFLYLPFRYIDSNGCPKSDTPESAYIYVAENIASGYYINIPLYVVTTVPRDINVYVKSIEISAPSVSGDGAGSAITGAVRCAVVIDEDGESRTIMVAKDSTAAALSDGQNVYYPVGYDGGAVFKTSDPAVWESSYYASHTELENPYEPGESNIFTLKKADRDGDINNYYPTKLNIRVWVEGTDVSALSDNAGAYFSVSLSFGAAD